MHPVLLNFPTTSFISCGICLDLLENAHNSFALVPGIETDWLCQTVCGGGVEGVKRTKKRFMLPTKNKLAIH